MKYQLTDLCSVIRSKNAGPYELTFDMIFKTREDFDSVVAAGIFNATAVCQLFGIDKERLINIVYFIPANAIKITIVRGIVSGDFGESDIYGAQQHGSLMDFQLEL